MLLCFLSLLCSLSLTYHSEVRNSVCDHKFYFSRKHLAIVTFFSELICAPDNLRMFRQLIFSCWFALSRDKQIFWRGEKKRILDHNVPRKYSICIAVTSGKAGSCFGARSNFSRRHQVLGNPMLLPAHSQLYWEASLMTHTCKAEAITTENPQCESRKVVSRIYLDNLILPFSFL